jgi:hypothetical protein
MLVENAIKGSRLPSRDVDRVAHDPSFDACIRARVDEAVDDRPPAANTERRSGELHRSAAVERSDHRAFDGLSELRRIPRRRKRASLAAQMKQKHVVHKLRRQSADLGQRDAAVCARDATRFTFEPRDLRVDHAIDAHRLLARAP